CLVRLLDEIFRVRVLRQIRRDGNDLAVRLPGNRRGRFLEWARPARADRNVDPFTREANRDTAADALAAAGHQRGLAVEPEIHDAPSREIRLYTNERC